jgi:hypothetical protein
MGNKKAPERAPHAEPEAGENKSHVPLPVEMPSDAAVGGGYKSGGLACEGEVEKGHPRERGQPLTQRLHRRIKRSKDILKRAR